MKELTDSIYSFADLRQGNYLYVDKTEYLWKMLRSYKGNYFLARPRRFGKSLMLSTIEAIFAGRRELFHGLAIDSKDYDWKKYPIIHLSFGDYGVVADPVQELPEYLRSKLQTCADSYGIKLTKSTPGLCFGELIDQLAQTEPVVILVDEYDKPILDNIANPKVQQIQMLLKGFYSVLKNRAAKERFLLLTGVSKFCHVSLFSDLNNLTDLTRHHDFATMFGYTQKELEEYFADRIQAVATRSQMSVEELLGKLKSWYDGYCFEENSETVYNPVSIAKFFANNGKFDNYWFSTGTPAFLMELSQRSDFRLQDALSRPVPGVTFEAFEIGNIDPVTLLLQTGYLTIKSWEDRFGKRCFWVDFPNEEVAEAFNTYLQPRFMSKYRFSPEGVISHC